jgi:hypothetical protein
MSRSMRPTSVAKPMMPSSIMITSWSKKTPRAAAVVLVPFASLLFANKVDEIGCFGGMTQETPSMMPKMNTNANARNPHNLGAQETLHFLHMALALRAAESKKPHIHSMYILYRAID